jgi:hypothetical protein
VAKKKMEFIAKPPVVVAATMTRAESERNSSPNRSLRATATIRPATT